MWCAWPSNLHREHSQQSPPDCCWRQCPIKVQSSASKWVALTGNSNSNFNSDQASGNEKNKNTSITVTGSFKSHGEQLLPKDVSASFVKEPGILVWPKFYTKCYRLTSLPNCMLSLYKGKENDTLLKAYHYYKEKEILNCKGLEHILKNGHIQMYIALYRRQICPPVNLQPQLTQILFNQQLRMSIHPISWQRAKFFFPVL